MASPAKSEPTTAVGIAVDVIAEIHHYLEARGNVSVDDAPPDVSVIAAADRVVDVAQKLVEHLASLSEDEQPTLAIERKGKRVTLAKLERETAAREVATRYYDWVKEQTARAPMLPFPAITKIVETAIQRGWQVRDIVIAMGEMYRAGATLTNQALERQLDGREAARARRAPSNQPRTATGRAMANLRERLAESQQKGNTR